MTTRVKNAAIAKDLMNAEVLMIASGTPIRAAVEALEEGEITGAPVLDAAGRAIGFFSKSDVARGEHVSEDRIDSERREHRLADAIEEAADADAAAAMQDDAFFAREDYSDELLGRETVDDWMRPEVVTVDEETPVQVVCRTMLDERIHRVLVVRGDVIAGILTTTDIVRYVAETG